MGTATSSTSGSWVTQDDMLTSSATDLSASCSQSDRYLQYHPDLVWDLPSLMDVIWPEGNCRELEPIQISGFDGGLCDYEFDGGRFVYGVVIVNNDFVASGALPRRPMAPTSSAKRS